MYIVNKKTFASLSFTHPNSQGLVIVTIRQDGKKEKKISYTRDENIKNDFTWAKLHFWNKWHVIENPVLVRIFGKFSIVETAQNSIDKRVSSTIYNSSGIDRVFHLDGETTINCLNRCFNEVESIN